MNNTTENLECVLSLVKDGDGYVALSSEEVKAVMSLLDEEKLKEYASWFDSVTEMVEWLAVLYRNSKRFMLPSMEEIRQYRTALTPDLRSLSSREVVELMQFNTAEEV